MTKNEDISNPFEVTERKRLAVQNNVDKKKYLTILFFSQHYTQLDTCPKFHPHSTLQTTVWHGVIYRLLACQAYPFIGVCSLMESLTAFDVPIPHMKATVSHPGRV